VFQLAEGRLQLLPGGVEVEYGRFVLLGLVASHSAIEQKEQRHAAQGTTEDIQHPHADQCRLFMVNAHGRILDAVAAVVFPEVDQRRP
jgi:hypothetical protein